MTAELESGHAKASHSISLRAKNGISNTRRRWRERKEMLWKIAGLVRSSYRNLRPKQCKKQ
ncbi:hypothetical protein PGT21_030804 [Puccinia graminis f. sp. tritici]|nr:hypothetical protein PGT21_030804 [Puccinia graminis f. sp. tritici]KAA1109245.1 hypothetical protein PGTUg99_022776 [Puccinia graminis f. sp. tritici]